MVSIRSRIDILCNECVSYSKVESAFFDSRIRINGKKLLKKSQQVMEVTQFLVMVYIGDHVVDSNSSSSTVR